MPELDIAVIPLLKDNYGYLIHDPATGQTAALDPSVAPPMLEAIANVVNQHVRHYALIKTIRAQMEEIKFPLPKKLQVLTTSFRAMTSRFSC